jgi:CheY-like chemotaxis protein
MTFDDGLWAVEVDPGELELAILNICVNARDAMPEGGTIRIAVRNARNLLLPAHTDSVTLSISDTGVGMSKEVVARVFEPFFTTKEVGKGSGLGLAQVYGFVNQSNGQVAIDSDVGRGTTVSLTFPRSEGEAAVPAAASQAPVAAARQAERTRESRAEVLLVEDDLTVATLTTEMLRSIGYAVLHVKSAAAALDALAAGRTIDVVFSDVMMPGGMSGVDLAREVRRRRPDLPVVLTTGYIEVARTAMTEGLQVLVKPYQLETLARILDTHVAARLASAQ